MVEGEAITGYQRSSALYDRTVQDLEGFWSAKSQCALACEIFAPFPSFLNSRFLWLQFSFMANDRLPRLIFASSEESADLLYATKFSVPDPVLFLKKDGKTTVLLSDLEIDRGRREANVDEVIALSSIERPLEEKLKGKPPIEMTIASFLRRRRVRKAAVPYNFPTGLANGLARQGVEVVPMAGLFWSERELKTEKELRLIQRAIRITEIGLARGIEVLQSSEIKSGKRLVWGGLTLTSEKLRAEIDTAILHAGGSRRTPSWLEVHRLVIRTNGVAARLRRVL